MGAFNDLVAKAGTSADGKLAEVWASHFPLLLEAFFPPPGKASGTFLFPKRSATIFSEGSRLKLVLGGKQAARKFWITLDGPEAVLEQVEMALKSGHGDWREVDAQD